MPSARFEPAIPAIGLPQAYALDRTVTGIGDILHEARVKGRLAAYFKDYCCLFKANWYCEGGGANVIQCQKESLSTESQQCGSTTAN